MSLGGKLAGFEYDDEHRQDSPWSIARLPESWIPSNDEIASASKNQNQIGKLSPALVTAITAPPPGFQSSNCEPNRTNLATLAAPDYLNCEDDMRHTICWLSAMIFFSLAAVRPAVTQTYVTTSGGTTNSIPKFTGTSAIGNSAITESNGSVGIGITNPSLPLQVNGPLRVENSSNSVGSRDSATDTSITMYTRSYGSVIQATNYQENSTKNLFINPWGGNVGIGTTSPQYKLDVNGTIRTATGIVFPDNTFLNTGAVGTITGVLAGTGLQGGGYLGNVSLNVDSTVARTTASQSFTGNQAINGGNLTLNIVNSSGGGLVVYGAARVQNNYGGTPLYIVCTAGLQGTCLSTDQWGNLFISGNLFAAAKPFRIDHPLDPANKYLQHVAVESPDMKTLYDGIVEIGADGSAWVNLPDYFEALNRDFRYQLTAMGTPAPGLYVAEGISGNRFLIAGGNPGMKVSWQVTGIRQDAYAKAYPIPVEEKKADPGTYIHPELFGQPVVPPTQ